MDKLYFENRLVIPQKIAHIDWLESLALSYTPIVKTRVMLNSNKLIKNKIGAHIFIGIFNQKTKRDSVSK